MCGTALAAQPFADLLHLHISGKVRRIHLFRRRMKNQIRPCRFTEFFIRFDIPRISREILIYPELDRIDKVTDHHPVIFFYRPVDQAFMPLMKISHSRHQTHAEPLLLPFLHLSSDFLDRSCYFHKTPHFRADFLRCLFLFLIARTARLLFAAEQRIRSTGLPHRSTAAQPHQKPFLLCTGCAFLRSFFFHRT